MCCADLSGDRQKAKQKGNMNYEPRMRVCEAG